MLDAPVLLDAQAAFRAARPFTTLALEHGVAVCELGYRAGRGRDVGERIVDTTAALVTLGMSEVVRNADQPDIAGIDLVLGARFGHGPLYRARGAYSAFRTHVTFPLAELRAGEAIWWRLRDEDQVSGDEILAEWNLRFDGSSPIVARHGRATVECRLLPRAVVEKRVAFHVRRGRGAIGQMMRLGPAAATRIAEARRPFDLLVAGFDRAASRADEELALARANTADPSAWPELAEAEGDFAAALRPVATARTARLARGFDAAVPAPAVSAVPLCGGRSHQILIALRPATTTPSGPVAPPPPPRIGRAFTLDGRGLVRALRFYRVRTPEAPARPTDPPPNFAIARMDGFDLTGRRPCVAPVALLVSAGRSEWALPVPR